MKRKLPKFDAAQLPQGLSFDLVPSALHRWNDAVVAKEGEEEKDNTISIYEPIGFDFWTGGGVTAKRIAAALRTIGKRDVVVNINSPGGDFFEGLAIYNMLRDHDGKVTCKVIGLAASAASVIAMAGDEVQIARAGFMMIHNAIVGVYGNRNDMRDAADWIEQFDDAMASLYAAHTNMDKAKIAKLMDKETWFSGDAAIEAGFADELLPADQVDEREAEGAEASLPLTVRALELACVRGGMTRSAARAQLNRMKDLVAKPDAGGQAHDRGKPDAAPKATLDAGAVEVRAKELVESFSESIQT